MSNYTIKGLPQIKLLDLLKKKRTNLKDFLHNIGIASYGTLQKKCEKMGVAAPTFEVFQNALGEVVSSPAEGLIVLDSPNLIKDSGGIVAVDSFLGVSNTSPLEEVDESENEDSLEHDADSGASVSEAHDTDDLIAETSSSSPVGFQQFSSKNYKKKNKQKS